VNRKSLWPALTCLSLDPCPDHPSDDDPSLSLVLPEADPGPDLDPDPDPCLVSTAGSQPQPSVLDRIALVLSPPLS
jgi:hypothetical protein